MKTNRRRNAIRSAVPARSAISPSGKHEIGVLVNEGRTQALHQFIRYPTQCLSRQDNIQTIKHDCNLQL